MLYLYVLIITFGMHSSPLQIDNIGTREGCEHIAIELTKEYREFMRQRGLVTEKNLRVKWTCKEYKVKAEKQAL